MPEAGVSGVPPVRDVWTESARALWTEDERKAPWPEAAPPPSNMSRWVPSPEKAGGAVLVVRPESADLSVSSLISGGGPALAVTLRLADTTPAALCWAPPELSLPVEEELWVPSWEEEARWR
jgi:hypothetical protein